MTHRNYKESKAYQLVQDLCSGMPIKDVQAKYEVNAWGLSKILTRTRFSAFTLTTARAFPLPFTPREYYPLRHEINDLYVRLDKLLDNPEYQQALATVERLESEFVASLPDLTGV